jgi:hypothetical protein
LSVEIEAGSVGEEEEGEVGGIRESEEDENVRGTGEGAEGGEGEEELEGFFFLKNPSLEPDFFLLPSFSGNRSGNLLPPVFEEEELVVVAEEGEDPDITGSPGGVVLSVGAMKEEEGATTEPGGSGRGFETEGRGVIRVEGVGGRGEKEGGEGMEIL